MSLLDEVKAAATAEKEQRKQYALERNDRMRSKALLKFSHAWGETPDKITMKWETLDTYDGTTTIYARLPYDGVEFAYCCGERSSYPELHVILTCPTCGREVISRASFYGMKTAHVPSDRERNVKTLAEAFAELRPGNWSEHRCRENVLKPLRYAIRVAADKLGESVVEVVDAALR